MLSMLPGVTTSRGPVLLILASAFLAAAANGISLVVLPWLVLQRTGSASAASVVAAAATLPLLFATLVAGTAVDFLGRRRVAILADAMSALSVAAIPVIALTAGIDALSTLVLAGLAALGAFFDPAGMTARLSMLPEAGGRAGWTLDHTNSVDHRCDQHHVGDGRSVLLLDRRDGRAAPGRGGPTGTR
jgi:MFS family permease